MQLQMAEGGGGGGGRHRGGAVEASYSCRARLDAMFRGRSRNRAHMADNILCVYAIFFPLFFSWLFFFFIVLLGKSPPCHAPWLVSAYLLQPQRGGWQNDFWVWSRMLPVWAYSSSDRGSSRVYPSPMYYMDSGWDSGCCIFSGSGFWVLGWAQLSSVCRHKRIIKLWNGIIQFDCK